MLPLPPQHPVLIKRSFSFDLTTAWGSYTLLIFFYFCPLLLVLFFSHRLSLFLWFIWGFYRIQALVSLSTATRVHTIWIQYQFRVYTLEYNIFDYWIDIGVLLYYTKFSLQHSTIISYLLLRCTFYFEINYSLSLVDIILLARFLLTKPFHKFISCPLGEKPYKCGICKNDLPYLFPIF